MVDIWQKTHLTTPKKLASDLGIRLIDLQKRLYASGIIGTREYIERKRLLCFSLDYDSQDNQPKINHPRCRNCGIIIYDYAPVLEFSKFDLQENCNGVCRMCLEEYNENLTQYDYNLSWSENMVQNGWQKLLLFWYHPETGRKFSEDDKLDKSIFGFNTVGKFLENYKVIP